MIFEWVLAGFVFFFNKVTKLSLFINKQRVMTSLPSRTQVYEHRSFDNLAYNDIEGSLYGSSLPRRKLFQKSGGTSPSDETPVVYIDLEAMTGNSSTVASSSSSNQGYGVPQVPNFVHNTIFYNPFEDDKSKNPAITEASTSVTQPTELPPPKSRLFHRRTDSAQTTTCAVQPNLYIQDNQPQRHILDDGFTLTPIAVKEFPDLPPPYTEIEGPREIPRSSMPDTVITIPPPSTSVINTRMLVQANRDRKLMLCPHCGMRVYTLVVRQSGVGTHWLACVLTMLCLLPCVCLVYCTDFCKHKNHYCPNCNHMIGFEGLCRNKLAVK